MPGVLNVKAYALSHLQVTKFKSLRQGMEHEQTLVPPFLEVSVLRGSTVDYFALLYALFMVFICCGIHKRQGESSVHAYKMYRHEAFLSQKGKDHY